ncbi:MAG: hypothetical protein WB952_18325 [Terriglobales bacterium]
MQRLRVERSIAHEALKSLAFPQGLRPGLYFFAVSRPGVIDGLKLSALLFLFALFPVFSSADCLPVSEAHNHIGETQCITGKVFRVKRGSRGTTFFDFCEDFRVCPFTVVIFPGHLKDIGDVRQLADKVIEVHGPLKSYDGRAEIVVTDLRQLGGEGARIPKLLKDYDVEHKGKYSAGSFSLPRSAYTTSKKRQPATLPVKIPSVAGPGEEANPPQ